MVPRWYHGKKKALKIGLFNIKRRNRDLNPGTVLPIYKLSKPAPSTTWVFLHVVSFMTLVNDTIVFRKGKRRFQEISSPTGSHLGRWSLLRSSSSPFSARSSML